ncbi:MAG: hypothetical protein WCO82_00275 [Sphingomonadales bacterium]|jgi:hypothetical protein
MSGVARACAAPGCDQQAKPGQLMCRPHWFQVPKPIRDAIWSTWKARDMVAYGQNVMSAKFAVSQRAAADADAQVQS